MAGFSRNPTFAVERYLPLKGMLNKIDTKSIQFHIVFKARNAAVQYYISAIQ